MFKASKSVLSYILAVSVYVAQHTRTCGFSSVYPQRVNSQTSRLRALLPCVFAAVYGGFPLMQDRVGFVFDMVAERSSVFFEVFEFWYTHSFFLFRLLVDICVYERPELWHRFVVTYVLSSTGYATQLRVRTCTDGPRAVETLTNYFPNAAWAEREAFELFGVWFTGHPDQRRVVTDYGCDGYVGRKCFPIFGIGETFYSVFYGGVVHGSTTVSISSGKVQSPYVVLPGIAY